MGSIVMKDESIMLASGGSGIRIFAKGYMLDACLSVRCKVCVCAVLECWWWFGWCDMHFSKLKY